MTTVSVVVPTLNEADHIGACLDAVAAQTHPVLEVLVVDGGSHDRTREIAASRGTVVLDNPDRRQSFALNIGIDHAAGDVVVRIDGHCVIESDYVERCIAALEATGAAMVGGAMTPMAEGVVQRGIARAMASPLGAGPARFHVGGAAGWVDTVYLGAYRRSTVDAAGGYATDVGVNEDAELAHRMQAHGGVWFDPTIRSRYRPRSSLRALGRQFYRYGLSRAATVRRHPTSLAPRQLAAPLLVLALLTGVRRPVALVYGGGVIAASVRGRPGERLWFGLALPVMHVCWGVGFLAGLAGVRL